MKRIISIFAVLIITLFLSTPLLHADTGTPGNPPGTPTGGTPIGGGAPIGGGSLLLLGMAVAYGGRKLYVQNKEDLEE